MQPVFINCYPNYLQNPLSNTDADVGTVVLYNGAFYTFDGYNWQPVSLETESLDYKLNELEARIYELEAQNNKITGLQSRYPAIAELKEQLDLMIKIVDEHK